MKKWLVGLMAVLVLCMAGCEHDGHSDGLPYKEAEHYFLRNNTDGRTVPSEITTRTEFERYFGMAAVMGGIPTAIDFEREFVIAIVLPETTHSTTIHPGKLSDEEESLKLEYRVSTATEENSWTQVPVSLLVVDKKYDRGGVVLTRKN